MEELTCAELVEQVTDYLEGALTAEELARVREHLAGCDGCTAYVEQMRTALRVLESIPQERLSPEAEDAVAGIFRSWARGRPER